MPSEISIQITLKFCIYTSKFWIYTTFKQSNKLSHHYIKLTLAWAEFRNKYHLLISLMLVQTPPTASCRGSIMYIYIYISTKICKNHNTTKCARVISYHNRSLNPIYVSSKPLLDRIAGNFSITFTSSHQFHTKEDRQHLLATPRLPHYKTSVCRPTSCHHPW